MNTSSQQHAAELISNDILIDTLLNDRYTKLYQICEDLKNNTNIDSITFFCEIDSYNSNFMFICINDIFIFHDTYKEHYTVDDLKNISDLQTLNLTDSHYETILFLIEYCRAKVSYDTARSPFFNLCKLY